MSNEKNSILDRSDARAQLARRVGRDSLRPKPAVEVIALEIDEDLDLGGDPYNHTGSHCVIRTRRD